MRPAPGCNPATAPHPNSSLACRRELHWLALTPQSMPTTYEKLRADIITAMKARDTPTATALRTMDAAIQRASTAL